MSRRVSYIFPVSHHFRLPFHEVLRARLASHDIDYRVVYCPPSGENVSKGDTVDIDWGVQVGSTRLPGGLVYQHALTEAMRSDLVIVQQESRLALNYLMNVASICGAKRVAYFGHGRNFQSRDTHGKAERWKRFWATRCDWWFAYTEETRKHVESLGFPGDRITVFNNSIDTAALAREVMQLDGADLAETRAAFGITGDHVAIYVGGLYPDKRLDFLIEAADLVRAAVPDFQLIVVGGGVELGRMRHHAESRPWLIVTGPLFGREKVALLRSAGLFLMPGLVGLAILDAAAVGLPMVTTAYPWHSPEIAYLEHGVNGVMVADWQSPQDYAHAVGRLILDDQERGRLSDNMRKTAEIYSIEAMARRFAEGVKRALA